MNSLFPNKKKEQTSHGKIYNLQSNKEKYIYTTLRCHSRTVKLGKVNKNDKLHVNGTVGGRNTLLVIIRVCVIP